MNLADIREAFTEALSVIPDISVVYQVVGSVNPPAVILGAPSGRYDSTFGNEADMTWPLVLVVANAADGALDDLDKFLTDTGEYSVREAIDTYSTTAWDSARVVGFDNYGSVSVGDINYVGATFQVEVFV